MKILFKPSTSHVHDDVNLFEHNFPFLITWISEKKDILKFFLAFNIVLYMPVFRAVEIWSPNNLPLTMIFLLLELMTLVLILFIGP